jgi:hypothetical protein
MSTDTIKIRCGHCHLAIEKNDSTESGYVHQDSQAWLCSRPVIGPDSSFAEPASLLLGQHPWKDMPREELEREMEKAFYALQVACGVMQMHRPLKTVGVYWEPGGQGYRALSLSEEVFRSYKEKYGPVHWTMHDSFYRYAAPLLFETEANRKLYVCRNCRTSLRIIISRDADGTPRCMLTRCGGAELQLITWELLDRMRLEEVALAR